MLKTDMAKTGTDSHALQYTLDKVMINCEKGTKEGVKSAAAEKR